MNFDESRDGELHKLVILMNESDIRRVLVLKEQHSVTREDLCELAETILKNLRSYC